VNWQIRVGTQCAIGVENAAEIVRNRLAYIKEKGSECNQRKLLEEALQYATLVRDWVRENQPIVEPYVQTNTWGKPGPMSDG
jgi:hypothetical protein